MTKTQDEYYGVIERSVAGTWVDLAIEEINRLGYTVIDAGMSTEQLQSLSTSFDIVHEQYIHQHSREALQAKDELNTIRMPLSLNQAFLDLARNENLHAVINRAIAGKYTLNQQNGIINPAGTRYNQDRWHRDLPYQHFVSSRPLAINALFCVDPFTPDNGATSVLPATHLREAFPSASYIERHKVQAIAPAGSFIIIDCMTYHRGERNQTSKARRAVNHVFTIPYIKQQIAIPPVMAQHVLDEETRSLLGFDYAPPQSVEDYLRSR